MPFVQSLNLRGSHSLDILNGWDLSDDNTFTKVLELIYTTRPMFTMMSPPCTGFSKMQVLLNISEVQVNTCELIKCERLQWVSTYPTFTPNSSAPPSRCVAVPRHDVRSSSSPESQVPPLLVELTCVRLGASGVSDRKV
jgi:hypothetical protein